MEVMGKDTSISPLASCTHVHTHAHAPEHTHILHTKTDVVYTHDLHTGEVRDKFLQASQSSKICQLRPTRDPISKHRVGSF